MSQPTKAKAIWVVLGGIELGKVEREYSRQFTYDSNQYEADRHCSLSEKTVYERVRDEAYEYAKSLSDPKVLNWVKIEWVWF